ncbi:MAG: TRIC cation channel family protein [Pedobacter sp.]
MNPGICVALGTITGCFGGVCRDILLAQIPVLFRKEIYATACIVGGIGYFVLLSFTDKAVAEIATVLLICTVRIVGYRRNWYLPSL